MVRSNLFKNQRRIRRKRYQRYRMGTIFVGAREPKRRDYSLVKRAMRPVLFGVILLASAYFVFFSNVFMVTDVIVEGNHFIPTDTITKGVPRNTNIFRLDTNHLKRDLLAQFTEIRDIEVYRGIPNALKLVVLERDAIMIWQTGDKKYFISSLGEVVREVRQEDAIPDGTPLVYDRVNLPVRPGATILSPNFVTFVTNFNRYCSEVTGLKPGQFEVMDTTLDINIQTDAGFYVKLNTLRSSRKQLENLKRVLDVHRPDIHEYVDLRIDGWAYYK